MKAFGWYFILYGICIADFFFVNAQQPKIVALVPGHNDGRFLSNCFKALAKYVDAIIYLDDASTDNSIAIVKALAKKCKIEQILYKENWIRDAGADRNMLLAAGRAIGGTHFVLIDADEMPTANLLDGQTLRRIILNLKPGERLALAWIQLWRSCEYYRYDSSVWTNNYKDIAFCDDGSCYYLNRKLCESRTPDTLQGKTWFIEGYEYGLLHFQFVNFENLLRKQAWYRCQERILHPIRTIEDINKEYAPSKDETCLGLKNAPYAWFAGYDFFDFTMLNQKEYWREQEVMTWFTTYGIGYFAGLDIWDTEWSFDQYIPTNSTFLDTFIFSKKVKGCVIEVGVPTQNYNPATYLCTTKNWYTVDYKLNEATADLYLVHESKYIDEHVLKNHYCIVVHQSTLHDHLMNLLTSNNYMQIPYNDNGYYYFIHCKHG